MSEALERGRARGMGMAKGQRGGRTADGGTREGPGDGRYGRSPGKGGTGGTPAEDGTRGAPAEGGTRGAPAEEHRHSRLPAGRSCSRADASPQKPIPGSIFQLFHVKQCRSRTSNTYTHNPKQESNCTPISQPAPCKKECAMEIAAPAGLSARPVRVFRVLRRMRAPWRVPRAQAVLYRALRRRDVGLFAKRPGEKLKKLCDEGSDAVVARLSLARVSCAGARAITQA